MPTEPKALDDDPRASQRQPDMFPRYIDRDREAKADDADLVERDAAKLAGEANGTAGLVLDPSHRQLVGPHIGPGDVIREIAHRRCKGTDQPFLGREGHLGIGKYHRFAAAVRQLGRGILEGHRPGQPEGFLGADIVRYAHATDCRPAGDLVDCDDSLEPDGRPVNVDELQGPERVGKRNTSPSHPLRVVHGFRSHKISDTTRLTARRVTIGK